jgi:hypothetical protein
MRSVLALLACVAGGGLSVALADPPAAPAATPEPATQATAATPGNPAAAPVAATSAAGVTITGNTPATPAAPQVDAMEKHFLSEGYKIEMRHGDKYFCRREEELGSRLGGQKYCSTMEQLKATEAQAKDLVGTSQRQQTTGPSGR